MLQLLTTRLESTDTARSALSLILLLVGILGISC